MYLFIDIETNGIPRKRDAFFTDGENWPRLVQIAWALTDDQGSELRTQSAIIRPDGFKISARVTRERGITSETALQLGHDLGTVLPALAKDLEAADALVAHNVKYDEQVVRAEFYRTGFRMSAFIGKKLFCTMHASTNLCRIPGPHGYKWPRLEELYSFLFGETLATPHDATADVRACMRCFFELKRRGALADQELFEDIYRLADRHARLDLSLVFVDDVHRQFEKRGRITPAQRSALGRIRNRMSQESQCDAVSARSR